MSRKLNESRRSIVYNSNASEARELRPPQSDPWPALGDRPRSLNEWHEEASRQERPATTMNLKQLLPPPKAPEKASIFSLPKRNPFKASLRPRQEELSEHRPSHGSLNCNCDRSPRIQINVANDSKVEIKEEFDYLNRKLINISIDNRADPKPHNSLENQALPLPKPPEALSKVTEGNPSTDRKRTGERGQKSISTSYQSIQNYQKALNEKLSDNKPL